VWYTKLPFRKANAIFWRYLYRSPRTKYYIVAAVVAPICFALIPEDSKIALQSALVGMAMGMVLIWSVRLVAQYILGVEAMGFGDVTLMGMIGAFLGWQAALLVFFMAPFFGLVYGIINVALGRGKAVPYGPFLCLATVSVVIFWSPIWSVTAEYFAFGIGVIGTILFGFLFVFAGLLHVVHKIMSPK
jgi:prepilin signal peptidase PulO-like enzyme (type II secretory pathway)